jgi:hypothetical protein
MSSQDEEVLQGIEAKAKQVNEAIEEQDNEAIAKPEVEEESFEVIEEGEGIIALSSTDSEEASAPQEEQDAPVPQLEPAKHRTFCSRNRSSQLFHNRNQVQ